MGAFVKCKTHVRIEPMKLAKEEGELMQDESRRKFVKKMAYVPPAILTLAATAEFAKAASKEPKPRDPKEPKDPKLPK